MEGVILFILLLVLGLMPLAAYYLGWLMQRSPLSAVERRVLGWYFAVWGATTSGSVGLYVAAAEGVMPGWWLALVPFGILFIASPLVSIWLFSTAIRCAARSSLCTRCGYDLRGNESGRCPECGSAITRHDRRADACDAPQG